jgi:hypothetical protein
MTPEIKDLIKHTGNLVCPYCDGGGEVGTFCGHESTETCRMCAGKGIVKSMDKQTHRKDCVICSGKGCAGGCDWRGYQEWDSYELFISPANH